MKKNSNLLLSQLLGFILLACASHSNIVYVDNVNIKDCEYNYYFKQNEPREFVKAGKTDSVFKYHILDTTVKISRFIRNLDRSFLELKQNVEKLKDHKHVPYIKPDSANFYNTAKFHGQTCFSYAMECFCKEHGINPHPYFDSESLIDSKAYYLLLERLKLDCKAYSWQEFKKLKKSMPTEALIALQSKGIINHGIYFNNASFHSKNGYSKPAIFPNLKSIVKSYKYTDTVLIYTPNKEKLLFFTEPI